MSDSSQQAGSWSSKMSMAWTLEVAVQLIGLSADSWGMRSADML